MERRGRIREVRAGAEGARVPPHDLEAEKAVIGAMLVSETAVASVAERLTAEDFYSEVHRIIYGAMTRLYSRGDPIDQLTLTNELRTVGEFDKVGGRAYVFQIVESVPTAANAGRYADIVRGKALLRDIIDVGSRITEDAFGEPEDVSKALDAAEQLVYGVSNRTLREHLSPVSELAPGALEMIQRLYEAEGKVTGVETGFEDLDRLTTGFHKSDLVILAARPAMGKTALALNAIWHASGEKNMPVAIFSLEMSKEQLVQRLISQITRIPAQALRSGNVKAEDWPKLVRGVAQVSRAPVWIDDTAGVTLMEIRAKVRRLSSQLKARGEPPLALVVVDYLQLMIGQGNRFENRQQEIAEISRGLKVLARDLDVPVLAIAQLSRAVEQRHDKRPLLSDLRDCVTGDTLVLLADGRRVPVRDLVGTTPRVLAMSPEGKTVEAESDRVWSVGRRPVFTVRFASGRTIRATARHRLFGFDGWVRVGELRPGDMLAVARSIFEPAGAGEWSDSHRAMAVARGTSYGGSSRYRFTPSQDLVAEYAEILEDDALRLHVESDLFWDRVVEVVPSGEEEVYDLTVPGPASWLADGIVSHNSGAIEQDADMVMFLYRDEYYNSDSDDKGIAEVIVGKHRNGPTGKVQLAWMEQYTKFASLARRV
jgi:replicative DNA helicase